MQRTPTHAMPALHANNGAFPFSPGIHPRMAWIHVSTKVDTHQQPRGRHPPRAAHAVTTDRGNPRSPQHSAKPGNAFPFSSGIHPRIAWIHVSTKVDTHQQQRGQHPPTAAWSTPTNSSGNLSKAGWVRLRGREPHGPEACLGRVGQDAQPGPCRVRRTAHTSKRRPSLHGRTCSVPRNRTHPAIPRNASF